MIISYYNLPVYWSQAQLISSSAPTVELTNATPAKSTLKKDDKNMKSEWYWLLLC